ncbi:MAG TPA: permease, partial [Tenericutes bacterium]|nr:permease [Mycoplasmatota bacterium]
ITYYFIILIKNNDTGWADLTSIISYLFVLAIGIILGLIGEGINYLIRSKKVND